MAAKKEAETFTRSFKSGAFCVVTKKGTSRWSITTENGRTRFSANSWNSPEGALAGLENYIAMCKERDSQGERQWMFYTAMSPKTLRVRKVFLDSAVG